MINFGQYFRGVLPDEVVDALERELTDIDLEGEYADSIHKSVAGEIDSLTAETPTSGDQFIFEDSSDGNSKKKCDFDDLLGSTILDKLDATADPTVNDDSAAGYSVGSKWVNVTGDLVFFCVDASAGAAVWNKVGDDSDAIHSSVAGELAALTSETPAAGDFFVFEDVTDSNNKKRCDYSDLAGSGIDANAIHKNTAGEIVTITAETPASGDQFIFEDASDANNKKRCDYDDLLGTTGDFVTVTAAETHVYADGTSGDDLNDGLTVGTPVKTLQKVVDLVAKYVAHNTCLHLSGVFTDQGAVRITNNREYGAYLLLDGGSGTTTVAGPFTADASSLVSQLDVSGAGWTPDDYRGYWIEFTSGVLSGEKRSIQLNGSDYIYPVKNFSAEPDGCNFNIVRPTTEINGSTSLYVETTGTGTIHFQRFYTSGPSFLLASFGASNSEFGFSNIVMGSTSSTPIMFYYGGNLIATPNFIDPTTFNADNSDGIGISVRSGAVRSVGLVAVRFDASVLDSIQCMSSNMGRANEFMHRGSRCTRLEVYDSKSTYGSLVNIKTDSGFATTRIGGNGSGPGILLERSSVCIHSGVDISGNTGHGISLNNSMLKFSGAAAGSGNSGAGVFGKNNSIVTITDGSPPTLTGTVGDISVDGTTEVAEWSEIDAALELNIAGKLQVKEQ